MVSKKGYAASGTTNLSDFGGWFLCPKKNQGFLAPQLGVAKGCCQTVFKFKILPNTFGRGITGPSTACDPTVSFHKSYMEGLLPKNVVGISCFVLKAFPKPLFSSDGNVSKNPSGNTQPF